MKGGIHRPWCGYILSRWYTKCIRLCRQIFKLFSHQISVINEILFKKKALQPGFRSAELSGAWCYKKGVAIWSKQWI